MQLRVMTYVRAGVSRQLQCSCVESVYLSAAVSHVIHVLLLLGGLEDAAVS